MKFLRNLILLLVLSGGVLFYTNPDSEDFSIYLAQYVQDELADDEPGETEFGQKLRKGLGQIASAAASQITERVDYKVASVYTIEMAGESRRFVGVVAQFFPIQGK